MNRQDWVTVECLCGRPRTDTWFHRYGGLQTHTHNRKGHKPCRMVVLPDPIGDDHWSWPVSNGERIETQCELLAEDDDVRERLIVCLYLQRRELLA